MNQEYFSVALSSDISLAIPLDSMRAAIQIEAKNICVIPGIADFWHGTINFKGTLLWVLDSDRYFNLDRKQDPPQKKLTAVIIQQQQGENAVKVALITPQLQGIISIESEKLEQIPDNLESSLKKCCSAVTKYETKRTFILNPLDLLEQLHQRSALVSA